MSYPPLPSNGEISWGNKFRAWADAIEEGKATVSDLASATWSKGIAPTDTHFSDLGSGLYFVTTTPQAVALGIPTLGSHVYGTLSIERIASGSGQAIWTTRSEPAEIWSYTWDGWTPRGDWKRVTQPKEYDSGWREIKALLLNGWTADSFQIRRKGETVYVRYWNLDGSAATSDSFIQVGAAWVPSVTNYPHQVIRRDQPPVTTKTWTTSIDMPRAEFQSPSAFGHATWHADKPSPTTLPGTPA